MSDLLTVTGLSVHYGGIQAVRDVSFSVKAGEQTTLIGANGAKKLHRPRHYRAGTL
jgi:branched-chain amino acid transport system ATP-binding protein